MMMAEKEDDYDDREEDNDGRDEEGDNGRGRRR